MPRRWVSVGLVVAAFGLVSCGNSSSPTPGRDAPSSNSTSPSANPQRQKDGFDYLETAYAKVTGRDTVEWAAKVALRYSGSPAATIPAGEIEDPGAWKACPTGAKRYAARRCPVSALQAIELVANEGARIVHDQEVPSQVGCDQLGDPGIPHARVISVRPDRRHRDCFSDFAVTLYLDDSDTVTAVDVVLSSP